MRKNIRDFFMGLKEPNFLAMKLLLSVFSRLENDPYGKRIVDSIDVLSQYDIRLVSSIDSCNYVYSLDDLSRIDYAIATYCSEAIACHEFGHLLLDVFARGELPDEFLTVSEICKKRLLSSSDKVKNLLRHYCDFVFKAIIVDIDDPLGFYNRHPEERDLYFKNNPDNDEDDLVQDKLIEHFNLMSAFDMKVDNYNKVANIIDALFCGDNPFCLEYGNDQVDPILSMHYDEYFETGDFGPLVMGFEEQFADYLVLRTFPQEMKFVNSTLNDLLGDEWFAMMDKFYDKVTSRVSDKAKVHKYK